MIVAEPETKVFRNKPTVTTKWKSDLAFFSDESNASVLMNKGDVVMRTAKIKPFMSTEWSQIEPLPDVKDDRLPGWVLSTKLLPFQERSLPDPDPLDFTIEAVNFAEAFSIPACFLLQAAVALSNLKNDIQKDSDGQELIGPYRFRKDAWISEVAVDKSLNLSASHITDPFAQCRLVASMTKRNMDRLLSRSGPETPTTYAQLYLAHVLGGDCAVRILKASADGQMPIDQALSAGFADTAGKVDLESIKKRFDKLFRSASGSYNSVAAVTRTLGDQLNTTVDQVQKMFVEFYDHRPDWKPSDSTKPPATDASTPLGSGMSGGPLQALFNAVVIKLAPSPKPKEFRDALISDQGWATLTKYGIAADQKILEGYLATVLMESSRLREFKESGRYVDNANGTAVSKLRKAFVRMRRYSDSQLLQYTNLHDDNGEEMKKFFNFAYCDSYPTQPNSLGNRPRTDDGYYFRGGGYTQITGRTNYINYGNLCQPKIDFSGEPPYPAGIDDPNVMLVLSAAEWKAFGCNEKMMKTNFDDVQRVINAGPGGSLEAVNDLNARRDSWAEVKKEFARMAATMGAASTS